MKNKWKNLLTKKQFISLFFLFFGMIIISFLEILGLASITSYVSILINNEFTLFNFFSTDLNQIIQSLTVEKRILYGSIFLFLLFLIKSILQILFNYFEVSITKNITVTNSKNYFKSMIYSPYKNHINVNSPNLIRKIQLDIAGVTSYFSNLIVIIKESLILISIFSLLFYIDPKISSLTFLLLGFASMIFYLSVKNKLTKLTKKTQINKTKMIGYINHSVSSFKENLILGIRKFIYRNYSNELESIEDFNLYSVFIMRIPRIFLELLAVSGILFVTFLFIFFEKPMTDIIPLLTLLVTSLVRMIPSFNSITGSLSTLKINRVIFNGIADDMSNQAKFTKNYKKDINQMIDEKIFNNEISLKNVSFHYEKAERKILDNISIKIKKGQSVGIIGKTGSGKTTLVDIILGVLNPTAGKILIDDHEMDEKILASWHNKIGYIPQDLYLINETIKKNIALGLDSDQINNKAIDKSLKIARLTDFISNLPEGIETKVGERGIKVSGGEKQRISIARAFYKNPSVIVMDEATSSLDNITEKEFMNAIDNIKNNSTLIIIAHRLSTISKCDYIYMLSNGEIKDEGSYEEIIKRNKEITQGLN